MKKGAPSAVQVQQAMFIRDNHGKRSIKVRLDKSLKPPWPLRRRKSALRHSLKPCSHDKGRETRVQSADTYTYTRRPGRVRTRTQAHCSSPRWSRASMAAFAAAGPQRGCPVSRPHDTGSDTNSRWSLASSSHGGLISWLICPFVLSTTRRTVSSSDGTETVHPSPPSVPRLSKKLRRAIAAMVGSNERA